MFDAALEAAAQMGFQVSMPDRAAGQLFLSGPKGRPGSSRRFSVSVTDNGLGGTAIHVSWDPRPLLLWPIRSDGRSAARFCGRIQQLLR